jgi:hypothetical protein
MRAHHLVRALLSPVLVALASSGCRTTPLMNDYVPRARDVTVTMVPLLVKESERVYPFLAKEFAPGGVLEGKEVYAFVPGTVTVVAGDTIHFTLVNPEDDVHRFVLPDLALTIPGGTILHETYVTRRPGVYPMVCDMPNHLPMMAGQLVVLAQSAIAGPGAR